MNFTLVKCFLKLSNVLNKNLNLTIILRTFKQQSTQNPILCLEENVQW
jgi:hypothetical protein